MNTKRLTSLAMLIAVYCVLSILTPVKVANFKFTFEAFPILVAALLMGPAAGLTVGGVGSFIYQLFFSGYGITATTPLWILPHAASGFIVGLYAKYRNYDLKNSEIILISIFSALLVTSLNLLALYVDAKLFGYYSKALVFGNLIFKIIAGILLAILYSSIMPRLLAFLRKKLNQ